MFPTSVDATLMGQYAQFGNVQQAVAVGYRRRRPFDDLALIDHWDLIRGVQYEQHVSYVETRYTDPDAAIDDLLAGFNRVDAFLLRRVDAVGRPHHLHHVNRAPVLQRTQLLQLFRVLQRCRRPARWHRAG